MTIVYKFIFLVAICFLCTAGGCETTSTKEAKQREKIVTITSNIASNNVEKISHIATYSAGVEYSLNKIEQPQPQEVTVALELNSQIQSLSGNPDVNDLEMIKNVVDGLLSDKKQEAERILALYKSQTQAIQDAHSKLLIQKNIEIDKYMKDAQTAAQLSDSYKTSLDKMDSWWGLGAIFYGFKKFAISISIFLLIVGVLFLILRGFASTNPIAASIFMVFEMVISWFINGLKAIFPKSVGLSSLVPKSAFDGFKSTLTKIVDIFQLMKEKDVDGNRKYTIDEILVEFKKEFNDDDNTRIDECKKDLHWKK